MKSPPINYKNNKKIQKKFHEIFFQIEQKIDGFIKYTEIIFLASVQKISKPQAIKCFDQ
jgi:hypothetical protein